MSSYSREGRGRRSRSLSRSRRSRSRSRSRSPDAANPGNNLYVTGLSTRVTNADLEKFFGGEGKVTECHLVTDPRTRESRGFAFVTMETVEGADRCIKYLNRSVLEGRLITVEKAKRSRGRTPTPGHYHGLREKQRGLAYWNAIWCIEHHIFILGNGRRRSRSYSPYRYNRDSCSRDRRGRSRSPYGRGRSRSPYGRRDHDLFRRRRERSFSAGSSGYRRQSKSVSLQF